MSRDNYRIANTPTYFAVRHSTLPSTLSPTVKKELTEKMKKEKEEKSEVKFTFEENTVSDSIQQRLRDTKFPKGVKVNIASNLDYSYAGDNMGIPGYRVAINNSHSFALQCFPGQCSTVIMKDHSLSDYPDAAPMKIQIANLIANASGYRKVLLTDVDNGNDALSVYKDLGYDPIMEPSKRRRPGWSGTEPIGYILFYDVTNF